MERLDKLIMMVNQIAENQPAVTEEDKASRTAAHLKRVWHKSMIKVLQEYEQQDGQQLSRPARQAVKLLS